jgi:PAS domain S-box-containing protein
MLGPNLATASVMQPDRRRKPRVLVVDDKQANHLALAAVLENECEMLFAASGAEALKVLQAQPSVDVVLMDVHMPEMDGFETVKRIKAIEALREIPVVFVTAVYQEDPFVKRGYEVGGIDYFSKPFDPEILRVKVAAYASLRLKAELLRQRELHIRESEEVLRVGRKLSTVLESLPVGILIADVDGRICQSTETVADILNYKDQLRVDLYGGMLEWWESTGQMIKDPNAPLARALKGESSHGKPMLLQCFDGNVKTVLVSASPLRGLEGKMLGAVVLICDLTEAKKMEASLAQRVANLINLGVELEETAVRQ